MLKRAAVCSWIVFGAMTLVAQSGAHFDVASVKVIDLSSPDGSRGHGASFGGPGTSDPGRLSWPAASMMGLLFKAYGVGTGQVLGAAVQPRVGADFYEVTATMPPDTTKAQFQTMLQNLLAERFHLVVHHETRDFPAYELVVDKGGPKLKEGPSQSDDGQVPTNPRANTLQASYGNFTMKDQTMEDLAQRLGRALSIVQGIQTQNTNLPIPRVVDKTGLTGKYTFSLDFTPPGFLPGPDSAPTDLSDLFIALRNKLGLRLNKIANVPVDVIVVDSVDKVPAEN